MTTSKNVPKKSKNRGKTQFRFEIPLSKLPNKNKELEALDKTVHDHLKMVRNVSNIYFNIINYYSLIKSNFGDRSHWYDHSKSLGFIYDNLSLNFYMKGGFNLDDESFNNSVNILKDCFYDYMTCNGMKNIQIKNLEVSCKWFCYMLYRSVSLGKCMGTYTRTKSNFKNTKSDISYSMTIRLIDFLDSIGMILPLTGYNIEGLSKVNSCFILNPEINDFLKVKIISNPDIFDNIGRPDSLVELRAGKEGEIVIRDDYDKDWITTIDVVEDIMEKFCERNNKASIKVMGISIPEIWFTRIHKNTIYEFGRIFDKGQIQTKTKFYRSLIEIDEEKTVSLDIKSLHPRMIMEMKGIVCEKDYDPYISDGIELDVKLINKFKKFYSIDKYNPIRNLSKVSLLCLINSKTEEEAIKAIRDKIYKDTMKRGTRHEDQLLYLGLPDDVLTDKFLISWVDKLKTHNHMIKDWLGSGKSGELQFLDSEIMFGCIKRLVGLDIPALPVHDALICAESKKSLVETLMRESYKEVLGTDNNLIIEEE